MTRSNVTRAAREKEVNLSDREINNSTGTFGPPAPGTDYQAYRDLFVREL